MKNVIAKYQDQSFIESAVSENTIKYDSEKMQQYRKDRQKLFTEQDVAAMKNPMSDQSSKDQLSFRITKVKKLLSPKQRKVEENVDYFRTHFDSFVEIDRCLFKNLSASIKKDINFKILDAQFQLAKALELQAKREKLEINPKNEQLYIRETITNRARSIMQSHKSPEKTAEDWFVPKTYKSFATKYGVTNGLHLKTYDEAAQKLSRHFVQSLANYTNPKDRVSTLRDETSFRTFRSHTDSQVKKYMKSGDIYFKEYIESNAPKQFKPQLMELQKQIEDLTASKKAEDAHLLDRACSLGKNFKRLYEYSHSDLAELEPKNVQFKKFKKLLEKDKKFSVNSMLQVSKRRRVSINTKVLKAIT